MNEALELGREDHVHEQESERESDDEVGHRVIEILRLPDELPAVVGRQVERLDERGEIVDPLAERFPLEIRRHHHLPLPREALDRARPLGLLEVGNIPQLDHPDARLRRGDSEPGDVGRVVAESLVGAEPDVVLLVGLLVGADREAADEDVGCRRDRLDRDTQLAGPFPVGDDPHLRLAKRQARVDVDIRPLGPHPVGDRLRIELELLHVGATQIEIDHHLPEAGARNRCHVLDRRPQVGIVDEDPPGVLHDFELAVVPLSEVDQPAVDAGARHLPLPPGGAAAGVADRRERLRHAAHTPQPLLDLGEDLVGALQRRPFRERDDNLELARVVARDKILADDLHERRGRGKHTDRHEHDQPAVRERKPQRGHVKAFHQPPHRPPFRGGVAILRLEKARAERRRHRERDHHAHEDRKGDDVAEGNEESPHSPPHEDHRNEDHQEREGGGDDRQGDLRGRRGGRLAGRQPILLHVAEDVFVDDHRIVDDDPDRQDQSQHRDVVDREAHQLHEGEGGDH